MLESLIRSWFNSMYHPHDSSLVCIYAVQIVINKKLFPCTYWFYRTDEYTISLARLKYAIGLLYSWPGSCTIYKAHNIPYCFWPSINVYSHTFTLIIVLLLYIIFREGIPMHSFFILNNMHPTFVIITWSNILHRFRNFVLRHLYAVHRK